MAITTQTSDSTTTSTTTPTVTLPTPVAAGDLLIVLMASDGARTADFSGTGFTEIKDQNGTGFAFHAAYKIAAGGETSIQPTMSTSERSNHIAIRVPAAEWHGTTPPEISTGVASSGTSTSIDPPAFDPSWATENTRWFAIAAADQQATPQTITAYPTNYVDNQVDNHTIASAGNIACASREANVASEDPGAFTQSVAETSLAYTLAIRLASGTLVSRTVADSLTLADSVVRSGGFLRTISDALGLANAVTRVGTFLRSNSGDYRSLVLGLNPVAYWRLGEATPGTGTAVDEMGNANGTYVGSPTSVAGAVIGDTAVEFSGTGQYVDIAADADLDLTNAFSVVMWVKRDVTSDHGLFEKTVGGVVNTSYLLFVESSSFRARIDKGGLTTVAWGTWPDTTDWHMAAMTYDGTNLKITLDAAGEVSSPTVSAPIDGGSGAAYIGQLGGGIWRLDGRADEVQVYNYALSPAQLTSLYQGSTLSGDRLTLGSTVAAIKITVRTVTDALGLADSVARVLVMARTAADALGLGDAVTRAGTFLRTATDSLGLANVATRAGTFLRTAGDALGLSDQPTRQVVVSRSVSDALGFADVVSRTGTLIRSLSDTLSLGNSVARVGTFLRTAADSLSLADIVEGAKVNLRSAADSLTLGNAATRTGAFLRTATDGLTLGNVVSRTGTFLRTAGDALGLSTAVTRGIATVRTATDSLSMADAPTAVKLIARTASDAISFADSVVASVGGGLVVIGGVPPRIAGAVRAGLRSFASRVLPEGGRADHSTPDGRGDHPKPGG